MNKDRTYWFPVKVFGWGWGLPICWQGWLVLVGYIALVVVGARFFHAHNIKGLTLYLAVLTVIFLSIVVAKGERPAGWRWRGK